MGEEVSSQKPTCPNPLAPILTRARLMYSSWAAFRFSFFPPQAFRAEACRARP